MLTSHSTHVHVQTDIPSCDNYRSALDPVHRILNYVSSYGLLKYIRTYQGRADSVVCS